MSTLVKRRFLQAALAVGVVTLSGCAISRTAEPLLVPPEQVEQLTALAPEPAPAIDLEQLYATLANNESEFETGVELIAAGNEVMGERRIAYATNRLREAVSQCATAAECDVELALDVFERLMTLQGIELKRQSARIVSLEEAAAAEDVEREPGTASFSADLPTVTEAASLLRGTDLREIIELNGPVSAALDDWLTWMRPMLIDSWMHYQFLRADMAPIYETAGLPEALLFAMMATETGGKVHSYSRAGAVGPLQFIRSTGRRYGLKVVDGFDTRLDPAEATRANVSYLNDLFSELGGSLELALAAYNAGEGRIHSLRRALGPVGIWDSRLYWSLPQETREYVPRILAAAWLFLHPEDYGVEFPAIDTRVVSQQMSTDLSLGELTICLGQRGYANGWFRTLRNLNPRLDPGERVPSGEIVRMPVMLLEAYEEGCLDGDMVARAGKLHDANYPPEPELVRYVVRRGDTLQRIASRHGCGSMRELAAFNGIRAPRYVIREGQTLKLPSCN